MAAARVASGVRPPGELQKPWAAMVAISSRQFMAFPVSASTRAAALKALSWVGAEVSRADVPGAGTARACRRFLVFAAWVFLVLIVVLLPKCCRPHSSNPVYAAAKRSPPLGGQDRDRP